MLYRIGSGAGIPKALLLAIAVAGMIFTSGIAKYQVNTAFWMAPDINPQDALQGKGHAWLKTLPVNTPVFAFYGNAYVQSFDKYSCDWCPEVIDFRKGIVNMSGQQIHTYMKSRGYEYAVIDSFYADRAGLNRTNEQLGEMISSGLFTPAEQASGIVILKRA
jgi:hypothetical protein